MNNTLEAYTLEDQEFDCMMRLFNEHDAKLEVLNAIDNFNCEEEVKHLLRIEWQSELNQIDRKILQNKSYQESVFFDLEKFEKQFEAAKALLEWCQNWIKFCHYNYGIVPDYNTEDEHHYRNFVLFANDNYKFAKSSLERHIQYSIPFTVSQLKDLGF